MALTRALSRRSLSLLTLPSICVRGMQSVKETKQAPADEEDDSLSTTTSPSLGWLRGPDANKPNKSVEDEWEELRDAQTGAVSWRSIMTGEYGGGVSNPNSSQPGSQHLTGPYQLLILPQKLSIYMSKNSAFI